jgi:hypothetical protein
LTIYYPEFEYLTEDIALPVISSPEKYSLSIKEPICIVKNYSLYEDSIFYYYELKIITITD